jgi:hypothetical protein
MSRYIYINEEYCGSEGVAEMKKKTTSTFFGHIVLPHFSAAQVTLSFLSRELLPIFFL